MKNSILAIWILFLGNYSFSQSSQIIKVNNALEFVEAIGSNRTIQLEGNAIYLSDISSNKSGSNYRFDEEYDGHELVIFNVSNLKIIGLGERPVKIITKPVYGDVIVFDNCKDIFLDNIDAGHGPEKGGCTGGVLNFSNSNNIEINNSILFGSGMEGITAEKVNYLKCNNTIIRGCTYSIMTLSNCTEFEFNNCEFSDNKEFDLINLSDCINVTFSKCNITNNLTGYSEEYDFYDYSLFNISQSMGVMLKECEITNNMSCYFLKKANSFKMTDCKLENNDFKKGNFKE